MTSSRDKFDQEFNEFLAQEDSHLATLYRKLPQANPDARLDAAVLAAARRAQQGSDRSFRRWLPALSAAAVVLFGAGIGYRVAPQLWNSHRPESVSADMSAKDLQSIPDRSASTAQSAAHAPATDKQALAQPAYERTASARSTREADAASSVDALTTPAPALETSPPAPADRPATMSAPDARAFPSAVAPVADEQAKTSSMTAGSAARLQKSAPVRSDAPVAGGAAKAEASPSVPQSAPRVRAPSIPLPGAPKPGAANNSVAPPSATAAPAPAPQQARAEGDLDAALAQSADVVFSEVRALRDRGDRDGAVRTLDAFRKRFPGYQLPADLRELR